VINREDCQTNDLLKVLDDLDASHAELCETVDRKINCMRSCDSAGLMQCVEAEQRTVEKIGTQEKQRRLLTSRILRGFGIGPDRVNRISAAELSEKLPPAVRRTFTDRAERLRRTISRTASRNRVANRLSGAMVAHFDTLLEAMATPAEQRGAYSSQGRRVRSAPVTLFEAVG
jgi:hypothetical protein